MEEPGIVMSHDSENIMDKINDPGQCWTTSMVAAYIYILHTMLKFMGWQVGLVCTSNFSHSIRNFLPHFYSLHHAYDVIYQAVSF